jgi:peptidase E
MTKYILHGGNTGETNPSNDGFFAEITKDVPEGGNILLTYFARNEEDWDRLFIQDEQRCNENAGGKTLTYTLAKKETFIEQLTRADAVYFRGGETEMLLDALRQYPNVIELLKNKTVAGSSAGAYALSTYYYSNSADAVSEGLGIIPIKVTCHFTEESNALTALETCPGNLQLVTLKNCEFIVI